MKLESIALHHGYESEKTTKAATTPIYQTTSFTFDDTKHGADLFDLKVEGNIYTRIMNPTNGVLEQRVAEMEGGIAGLSLASGMAAITYAIQCITRAGDNIVSTNQLYGGTYNLFAHSFPQQGINVKMVDGADFKAIDAAIDEMPNEKKDQYTHIYKVFRHHLLDLSDREISYCTYQLMHLVELKRSS